MSATSLPEVKLSGTLKVKPAETTYEELDEPPQSKEAQKSPEKTDTRPPASSRARDGVIGMRRAPEKKNEPSQHFLRKLQAEEILPKNSPQDTAPEVVVVRVSLVPYVISAFVLAALTLTVLFGLDAVVTTSDVATQESLDFNLASLKEVILGQ